ncbi:MAG: hypothetical protein QXS76_01650 [Candidatus Bathyarchaeia archaeon]
MRSQKIIVLGKNSKGKKEAAVEMKGSVLVSQKVNKKCWKNLEIRAFRGDEIKSENPLRKPPPLPFS